MTDSKVELKFNALTDPWLPLIQSGGGVQWASPVEVLCGEKDGVDLDYPRDDFRVYARLLLSALVQAVFAAKDREELMLRLEVPFSRQEAESNIKPTVSDFDLFGPTPFLQDLPKLDDGKARGAARFVFPNADLCQPAVAVKDVSLPVALLVLFIEQVYAGAGGTGYGPGPGGQPGVFTLIDTGSVRRSAWANSLSIDFSKGLFAPDELRPWSNARKQAGPRASIGIVGGLFFQVRSIWLIDAGVGPCSFTGMIGPRVRLSPLGSKSNLPPKPTKGEDVWTHPCAPMAINSTGIGPVRFNADKPTWTGLAQVLFPVSKQKKQKEHPLEGAAKVLQQWRALDLPKKTVAPRLLILDFVRDNAIIKKRFFESFSLTHEFLANRDLVERIRELATETENIARRLGAALASAHDDRKAGGLSMADAKTNFWASTEAPFLDWLSKASQQKVVTDEDSQAIQVEREAVLNIFRRKAAALFDEHVEVSEFDPRKQKRVAAARRKLNRELWPKKATATNSETKGVTK